MKTSSFFLLVIALACAGCQTMKAELPTARFDSPEALGNKEKRVGFNIGASPSQDFTFTSDASARPPNLSSPTLESSGDVVGTISYAAFERLDLGVRSSVGRSPYVLSAKYQLIGDPADAAKAGNFSLSFSIGVGFNTVTRSGDQNGTFGPGGHRWTSRVDEKVGDAAVIMGYRFAEGALFYVGGFAQNVTLDGKIEHERSDDGTSPAASYSASYSGRHRGGNFGAMFEFGTAPAYLVVEGVYSHMEFENDIENWLYAGAIGLGARF